MKKFLLLSVFAILSVSAFAKPINEKNPPKAPPPYGVYFLDSSGWDHEKVVATENAIAQHYGYKDRMEAAVACRKVRIDCVDRVRHKRDTDPVAIAEMKKYGFKNWGDAVLACPKTVERGDGQFCDVDPFLKLRARSK